MLDQTDEYRRKLCVDVANGTDDSKYMDDFAVRKWPAGMLQLTSMLL